MPVYNEEEIIETVVLSWYRMLEALDVDFSIRCYNDGSRDKTGEILDTLAGSLPRLIVQNKANSGHGATIMKGYEDASSSDWVFQIDSDNEILADQFEKLWAIKNDYDFLLGTRSHAGFPLSRRIISFIARLVIKVGFRSSIEDVNSPFRLFRSETVSPLVKRIPADTFAPNILITGLVSAHNLRVKEVAIENGLRQTGTVSIKHWRLISVALQSFRESISFVMRYRKGDTFG